MKKLSLREWIAVAASLAVIVAFSPFFLGDFFAVNTGADKLVANTETSMQEKVQIEELLCSGTLSVDELTEKSKRLPEVNDLIDEKTMRWLELSEIEE